MVKPCAGFSLAEIVVAMTLLSIGTLGVAATGLVAAHAFTRAEQQERVLREAEMVLDSLLALRVNSAGTRNVYGAQLSWAAADSAASLVVRIALTGRPVIELMAVR